MVLTKRTMTNVVIYYIHTRASIQTRLRPAIIYILRAGPSCRMQRETNKLIIMPQRIYLKWVVLMNLAATEKTQ